MLDRKLPTVNRIHVAEGLKVGWIPALALLSLHSVPSPRADALDNVKPGEWYEAPNTQMVAVEPDPPPRGNTGVKAVMGAWSGGAYDTKRDRLIVWGGGHGDYSGNEVYAFDIKALKWARLNQPSTDVGGTESSGIYPDGQPRSRHTYNYLTYVPTIDRFCSVGGAAQYPSGAVSEGTMRCFDFDSNTWEAKSKTPSYGIGTSVDFDPVTGRVWALEGGGSADWSSWDPKTDTWTKHTQISWVQYYHTPAIGQNNFVAVGDGKVWVSDLTRPSSGRQDVPTTGGDEIVAVEAPGLAYHPKSRLFIAWGGGASVYALDLGQRSWIKVPLAATNKVTPTAAHRNGTYGRFRYIPSKDLFVAVNGVEENVYFFRLPENLQASTSTLPRDKGSLDRLPLLYRGGAIRLARDERPFNLRIYDANRMVREYSGSDMAVRPGPSGMNREFEISPKLTPGTYFLVITKEGLLLPTGTPRGP